MFLNARQETETSTLRELIHHAIIVISQDLLSMEEPIEMVLSEIANSEANVTIEMTIVGPIPHTDLVMRVLKRSSVTFNIKAPAAPHSLPESVRE